MARQASHSSSSSSFSSFREWEYDVFLNFRGIDTRHGFTGYLYKALCDKGIHAFMDFDDLHRGNEISVTLLKAIEVSRIAILVFSKNYADSSYCLNELVKIMEWSQCHGQFVLPVFYDVDPCDVRHQRGSYGEAMGKRKERYKDDEDKVKKWRAALRHAAGLSGLHFKGDGYEYEFVGKIVERVSREIKHVPLPVDDYQVELESQVQASYSFYSFSSLSYEWKYNVFLNFRGTDTRFGFTGNLYKALCDKGIHAFMDDEDLHSGNEISGTLIKAIEGSKIAILVLSKNYAASSYCLDELVKIMLCYQCRGQFVLPVFYAVDPSDVRYQRGAYGEALARHEERFKYDMERVQKWRDGLRHASDLAGFYFKGDEYEHEFIEKIVGVVSKNIKYVAFQVPDYAIGLESQVLKVNSLLFDLDDGVGDDVHMVGIHGNSGTGKTALALTVYHLIADRFEALCFLENVRENSDKYGLVHLQNILLSEVLKEKNIKLTDIQQGISMIWHIFRHKKALLILDDVNKLEQLQAIAGKSDWFSRGTRVIITTRDKYLLACHGIERMYEVECLNWESSTIASTRKDNRTQLADKITSGEQIKGPLEPNASENIGLKGSKQTSTIQAEPNAEATGQFNENQAETSHTYFPEGIDSGQREMPNAETYTNIVESNINEDSMEAFYASLEAETTSRSHLQYTQPSTVSVITRPSEETQELKSAAAGLSRAEKMKEELEANVKEFKEMDMVEKSLCAQLAYLQKKKRELEDQINAIKAEIADFTAEKDTVAKRKREVFDSGKRLKGEGMA